MHNPVPDATLCSGLSISGSGSGGSGLAAEFAVTNIVTDCRTYRLNDRHQPPKKNALADFAVAVRLRRLAGPQCGFSTVVKRRKCNCDICKYATTVGCGVLRRNSGHEVRWNAKAPLRNLTQTMCSLSSLIHVSPRLGPVLHLFRRLEMHLLFEWSLMTVPSRKSRVLTTTTSCDRNIQRDKG
jgi:hypothetical protein